MDGGEGRGWEVRLDGGERDWVRIIERVEVKRQKKRGPVDWFVRLRVVDLCGFLGLFIMGEDGVMIR